ncbi:exodeoxyribonuclease VII large subunit [Leptothrix discophora]|uniref:Exodeoxyribonuclease 7 large subunit n=1 Tax=Leptothrix discophora TaxID=89 RepID=A0ABT9FYC3_LEPDI|nr:exodeoxyribonuclease VII large subunit [Leptothrix discophora]MDP4299240.1 exodeoxyribonuclease VII large subunit [Leptothrix discophora]
MSSRPFPPESGGRTLVWDVAALVQAVGDTLQARFGAVAVRGELAGFSRAASGHCYFNLKSTDGQAGLRCAMFRRAASMLDFAPRDGLQVELRGKLAVYEARGELQLIVEAMRPAGAGALMEQFLRLKAKLEAEGLFDAGRKREIAAYPQALGVVTSLGAAALRDVVTALRRRSPQVALSIYPASVQGADAPAQLVQAIQVAGLRAEVDTLLVVRGGGSLEDLWAFNDEQVVRAIAASPIPVISGVGHESDFTLADFVADLRAPTPTAAAELAAPLRDDALAELAGLARWMSQRIGHRLDRDAQRLDHLALRLARPADFVHRHRQRLALLAQRHERSLQRAATLHGHRLERLQHRLREAGQLALRRRQERLALLAARHAALDPTRVLQRGYAWLSDDAGRALTSVGQLATGQRIDAVLADGRIQALVDRIDRTDCIDLTDTQP